jgi:lipopolysaccharide/colanic/teichoic acid biosynthesis glycosyltransferase
MIKLSSTVIISLVFMGVAFVPLFRHKYTKCKPILDMSMAILGLIISLPMFSILGLLIKLTSHGPIFYTQVRVGKGGRLFRIIKLRTMESNAETITGPIWAKQDDHRITRLGYFMKNTHLDELPQLINVLKGEMSIIGPRPERPLFVRRFIKQIPNYHNRFLVKPGITGLAQIRHKYDVTIDDVKRKVRHDTLYIKKMCLFLDLSIMLRTPLSILVELLGHTYGMPGSNGYSKLLGSQKM